MDIKVSITNKATQQIIAQKSFHFEQPMPLNYVLACYMGQTLRTLSYDEDNQVHITKDGTMWQQETL